MHSKRHRKQRQQRAANKFRRAFRRDIEDNGGILYGPALCRLSFRNVLAWCKRFAKLQRKSKSIWA